MEDTTRTNLPPVTLEDTTPDPSVNIEKKVPVPNPNHVQNIPTVTPDIVAAKAETVTDIPTVQMQNAPTEEATQPIPEVQITPRQEDILSRLVNKFLHR